MSGLNLGPKLRYTDTELGIIKSSFADHGDLMALVRKFLLDGKMTNEELDLLKSFTDSPAVIDLLEKAVNPSLDKLAPAFQTVDLFTNLNFEPVPFEHAVQVIKSRVYAVKYLTQRFRILRNEISSDEEIIHFDDMIVPEESNEKTFIKFLARNFMVAHVDTQLFNSLMIIAGEKEETLEQQKKRLTQNSSK